MNKNILRAFKRELISIYEVFEGSNLISGFREKIKEFSDNLLFTSNFDSADKKDFNYNKFYTYVAILINYCRMKKLVRTDEEKEQLKLSYEVIYSYSHQKFSDFISIPEVATLIKIIISKKSIEGIIENNETLNQENREKYRDHISDLFID